MNPKRTGFANKGVTCIGEKTIPHRLNRGIKVRWFVQIVMQNILLMFSGVMDTT